MTDHRTPVISFHRSWRSLIPQFTLAFIVTVIGYQLSADNPLSSLVIPFEIDGESYNLRLPLLLLIVIFLLVRPIVMLFDSHFEISDHHLRVIRGKLSVWRRRQEFTFEDLLGVQVTQSIWERVIRVGAIRVGSKTQSIEVYMRGIPRPQHYADLISRRIDSSRIKERAGAVD